MRIVNESITTRGMEYGFSRHFGRLEHLRIRIGFKRDDIESTWNERWQWLGYEGDCYNDSVPYDGLCSRKEEWEFSKQHVSDSIREHLRKFA
jgi:hypothetical protein